MNKKYSIGTPIKYIGYCRNCKGKTGKIIKVGERHYYIVLPKSTCGAGPRLVCDFEDVELINIKGQQLLFSFMEK